MSIKEGAPVLVERVFNISKKKTHKWLAENIGSNNYREIVGQDIVKNIKDLFPDISVDEKFFRGYVFPSDYQERGSGAVNISLAGPFAAVARDAGWDMDSPQIVYMIGYRVRSQVENLKAYPGRASEEADVLLGRMDNSLEEFARQKFLGDPTYIKILQILSETNPRLKVITRKNKDKFYELFNAGSYSEALRILQGDNKDVSEGPADVEAKPKFPTAGTDIMKVLEIQFILGREVKDIPSHYDMGGRNIKTVLRLARIKPHIIRKQVKLKLRSQLINIFPNSTID